MRIAVVTDSVACVPPALARELGIHVIPLHVTLSGSPYLDGVDLTPTEFYRRFRESMTPPTTSQPSLGDFARLYARLGQEVDGIVSIHLADSLSATVETARLAAEQASPVPVRVVNSGTATAAEGFVVLWRHWSTCTAAGESAKRPVLWEHASISIPSSGSLRSKCGWRG